MPEASGLDPVSLFAKAIVEPPNGAKGNVRVCCERSITVTSNPITSLSSDVGGIK